tara:strand:- start:46 stop:249 length:204 start_codon:yes stop_codon:yes gene_type:complete
VFQWRQGERGKPMNNKYEQMKKDEMMKKIIDGCCPCCAAVYYGYRKTEWKNMDVGEKCQLCQTVIMW